MLRLTNEFVAAKVYNELMGSDYLGLRGARLVARTSSPKRLAVIHGLTYWEEKDILLAMADLLYGRWITLNDDCGVVLVLARTTDQVRVNVNRLPVGGLDVSIPDFARIQQMCDVLGNIEFEAIADVQQNSTFPTGLAMDISGDDAALSALSSKIPVGFRLRNLVPEQKKTGSVPVGTIYRKARAVTELLLPEDDPRVALNVVASMLSGLGFLQGTTLLQKEKQHVVTVNGTILGIEGKTYKIVPKFAVPSTEAKEGEVVAYGQGCPDLIAAKNALLTLGPTKTEVVAKSDPMFYTCDTQIGEQALAIKYVLA